MRLFVLASGLFITSATMAGERLLIAVASNFQKTAQELATSFEARTGASVRISSGSTGKLYAQILNGAPYDVFLSADVERAKRLADTGLAVAGSRNTYAEGRLVLWSADKNLAGKSCEAALREDNTARLAIANPKTAPYGRAAMQYLTNSGLIGAFEDRIVVGENIAQTLQFADIGGARFGLIALSQSSVFPAPGCTWQVPGEMHEPIWQQAVVLQRARNPELAMAFAKFLQDEGRPLIAAAGYELAEDAND